jgi:carboxypeptidase Q
MPAKTLSLAAAVGIPGFQFIQDHLDYESRTHHSNQNVFERLQPAGLKQIATAEAIFVYNAAQRDQIAPAQAAAASRAG